MKYSDLIGDWLVESGYTHCFFVAGGGIMHLLDAFKSRFECIPVVHECSAGIVSEHFNECSVAKEKAFALVTTGPGVTNIVTPIAGCFVEHRELLVIAGQVKSSDIHEFPERQRGVQEIDGVSICKHITVDSVRIDNPISKNQFKALVNKSRHPHPGPIFIEICLDVQGRECSKETICNKSKFPIHSRSEPKDKDIDFVNSLLKTSKRPLVLLGGLVSRQSSWSCIEKFEKLGLPIATTTSAIDRINTNSQIFAGRPGTWGGQRAGNMILAQADLVIAIGAQLDLQQTGFNFEQFCPNALLVHIFPSDFELKRRGPPAVRKINCNSDKWLIRMADWVTWKDNFEWVKYIKKILNYLPSIEACNSHNNKFINAFQFLKNLSIASDKTDILALCSSGGTFTGALQNYETKFKQIATTSPAHASMGYGLATAIGAAFANPNNRIILTEGDGGFAQNLQELSILKNANLNIKIFLIQNNGYGSIRATQKKFFNGAYIGCDVQTRLSFPDWENLFASYNIPCNSLDINENSPHKLKKLLEQSAGPEAWVVKVDPEQTNWPALSTEITKNGNMVTSPLYSMLPPLSDSVLKKVGKFLPQKS